MSVWEAFDMFRASFHGIDDILYLLLFLGAFRLIRRSTDARWQGYCRGLLLVVVAAVLTLCYRTLTNLDLFFGLGFSKGFRMFNSSTLMIADVLALVGLYQI